MKKRLMPALALFSFLLLMVGSAQAQKATATPDAQGKANGGSGKVSTPAPAATAPAKVTITAATSPVDLARAAYLAQGGDKFRDLKSMVLKGSVDLYAPNSVQSQPGKFVIVTAGERSRIEIQSPVFGYRQISDGTRSFSSVPQMDLPPANKFGLNVLMKYNQPGYTVSALEDKNKQRAFRITDAEGFVTDFYIDPANGRVMSYLIPYRGYVFGVDNKTFKEMDGVLVPYVFTQRLELSQGAFFAEYKVKEVNLNQEIADDVFEIPEK